MDAPLRTAVSWRVSRKAVLLRRPGSTAGGPRIRPGGAARRLRLGCSGRRESRDAMEETKPLLLEVIYKAHYCLPCYYMDEAIREVLPQYEGRVEYRRVAFMDSREDKKRFTELSISLYGKEKVYRMERLAPVPSLFIDGKMVFDAIPPRPDLEAAIEQALSDRPELGLH